ncbi:macro domain-containing protein [Polynucleobacter sp. JS-Polo-80-F4]|uniref:macro domain-containing protein n=1 Tax=Polynucleobacter sp. JS-Polo-80-F4 TaxID=2576918 RepID=UPI001C0B9B53|nr:macro domain-containing protein [Polynucleobacter sp. JS-Polo-80-F4]MBU3617326.1 macro domain-containing protein [Polynucleobacter sp. JS-Polo-80-F4]
MQIECVIGDITKQVDCWAIVNAANPMLLPGAGVAGAIHKAAGPQLEKACEEFAPIEVSQAVVTPGFNLPNFAVIHVLGPKYFHDVDPGGNLAKAIDSVLELANKHQFKDIALPAISTGSYGFPIEEAASIIISRLKAWEKPCPMLVRLVLIDEKAMTVFKGLNDSP